MTSVITQLAVASLNTVAAPLSPRLSVPKDFSLATLPRQEEEQDKKKTAVDLGAQETAEMVETAKVLPLSIRSDKKTKTEIGSSSGEQSKPSEEGPLHLHVNDIIKALFAELEECYSSDDDDDDGSIQQPALSACVLDPVLDIDACICIWNELDCSSSDDDVDFSSKTGQ